MTGLEPALHSLSPAMNLLLKITIFFIWPCQAALSGLVSLIITTTVEKDDPLMLLFRRFTLGPLYTVLVLLFLPFAICAIPLRCLLCWMRHQPYQYSVVKTPLTESEQKAVLSELSKPKHKRHEFGVASANVCLLPEFLARYNNVSHAGKRAKATGERIVVDQLFYSGRNLYSERNTGFRSDEKDVNFIGGLGTHFPALDFLCMQEVFDWNYNKVLRRELHKVFPYILHDVGVMSLSSNYFLLNSGLMFASRHPVLCADFKFFPHSISQCIFSSKGVLMVKVLIGSELDEQRKVAYIFNTHLQSYQGTEPVIKRQLDDILVWREEFRQQTADSRDVVLFDILCGDLNFDNMSPGDREYREHPIFNVYRDPCRVIAGKDQNWAVGTEFKQLLMHESTATSPESLKTSLADPILRHRHLNDADVSEHSMSSLVHDKLNTDEHGNVQAFPAGGMRRIDYILWGKQTTVDISSYTFVTRLASLTDHIPVAMTFRVQV